MYKAKQIWLYEKWNESHAWITLCIEVKQIFTPYDTHYDHRMQATMSCWHNSTCFHSGKLGCSKFQLSAKNKIFCAPSFKLYEVEVKFLFYPCYIWPNGFVMRGSFVTLPVHRPAPCTPAPSSPGIFCLPLASLFPGLPPITKPLYYLPDRLTGTTPPHLPTLHCTL
jgi:hypothetical protein